MNNTYSTNYDCFALYSNSDLSNLNLKNITIGKISGINIEELCSDFLSHYKEYYQDFMLSQPINICVTCKHNEECLYKNDTLQKIHV